MRDFDYLAKRECRSMPGDRLESWKEIAAYLKRDVATVRRWGSGKVCQCIDTCTRRCLRVYARAGCVAGAPTHPCGAAAAHVQNPSIAGCNAIALLGTAAGATYSERVGFVREFGSTDPRRTGLILNKVPEIKRLRCSSFQIVASVYHCFRDVAGAPPPRFALRRA